MSVSSTRVRTWTVVRSAIRNRTVPPATSRVGEEITVPGSTLFWMIVPVMGALTWVSSMAMRAFSNATSERMTSASALANSSCDCSNSVSVNVPVPNSVLERSIWVSAISRLARAAARLASVSASVLRGTRWSTSTNRKPASTTSPVSA